jgi:putative ABC transport system substrate-binding protein
VWPLAARAQQTKLPVIGFLDLGPAAERTQQVAAFRKGLAEAGYLEGQNVALEYGWAEGHYGRFGELAADLVRRGVSVIVTLGGTGALAAKAATAAIPIVSARPAILSRKGSSPASIGLAAMPPASTSSHPNWSASGCSSCAKWCRQPIASRCWSIRAMRRTIS